MILSGCQFFETHHQEIAPWGWQFGFCHTFKLHVILQKCACSALFICLFCHKLRGFT
jgi:hypothetical protein